MSSGARGPAGGRERVLVVDASCLYPVVTDGEGAEEVRARLARIRTSSRPT